MLLKDLLSDVPGVLETRGDAEIQALVTDSREKARTACSSASAACALTRMILRRRLWRTDAWPWWWSTLWIARWRRCAWTMSRRATAYIAAAFYGHPARQAAHGGRVRHKGQNDHHLSDEGHSGKGRVQ